MRISDWSSDVCSSDLATELRAMKNYAGHRLSPWLGHLMVSRQETARALLTTGEVMQLPPHEEIVMVAGVPPIRADKARYYVDAKFTERNLPTPETKTLDDKHRSNDDWTVLPAIAAPASATPTAAAPPSTTTETGR